MKLTTNYNLKKPESFDVVNVDDFNHNADIIDHAIQDVKAKVDGLELKAEKVTLADNSNLFNASNVEDALLENKNSILANTQLINALQVEVNGQRLRGINIHNQLENLL